MVSHSGRGSDRPIAVLGPLHQLCVSDKLGPALVLGHKVPLESMGAGEKRKKLVSSVRWVLAVSHIEPAAGKRASSMLQVLHMLSTSGMEGYKFHVSQQGIGAGGGRAGAKAQAGLYLLPTGLARPHGTLAETPKPLCGTA